MAAFAKRRQELNLIDFKGGKALFWPLPPNSSGRPRCCFLEDHFVSDFQCGLSKVGTAYTTFFQQVSLSASPDG